MALARLGKRAGLWFRACPGGLPTREPIDRVPRIVVLTGAVNQDVWSLRNLGFAPTRSRRRRSTPPRPIRSRATTSSSTPPLAFGREPAGAHAAEAFFARGGGYLGAGTNGGDFLTTGAQLVGLTAVSRTGNGRSGILYWANTLGAASPVVGTYPAIDTAIVDPPTWFTTVPSTLTVDGRLPLRRILVAGLWLTGPQSASAPGSAVIAHGTNAAGTAR